MRVKAGLGVMTSPDLAITAVLYENGFRAGGHLTCEGGRCGQKWLLTAQGRQNLG